MDSVNYMAEKQQHILKNCKDGWCKLDHKGLTYCMYHGKWTNHIQDRCEMFKSDIALQKQASQIRHGKSGCPAFGSRGRSRGSRGARGGISPIWHWNS
eukprot:445569-Rhodomonas_salina.1